MDSADNPLGSTLSAPGAAKSGGPALTQRLSSPAPPAGGGGTASPWTLVRAVSSARPKLVTASSQQREMVLAGTASNPAQEQHLENIRASMRVSLRASQARGEAPNLDSVPAPAAQPSTPGTLRIINPMRLGSRRKVDVVDIPNLPFGGDIDAARDAGDTNAARQIYETFERQKRADEGIAKRATRHVPKLTFDVPDANECVSEECLAMTCCLPAYAVIGLYIAASAFAIVLACESLGSSAAYDGSSWKWMLCTVLMFVITIPTLCGYTGAVVDDSDSGMIVCLGCMMLG